ncbi:nucleolin-like [Engraulis encrasicolus]|uniref:nucleolin-like n=1 Tax=Engraulis encrasicolus TaxID=184585 RepID=UPI002FD5E9E0
MPKGRGQPMMKVKEEDTDQQLERNPTPGDGAAAGPPFLKGEDFNFESDCDQKWQPGVSGEGKRRREEGGDDDMEEEDVVLTESEDSDDDVLVVLECEGDDADWALFRDDDDDDDDEDDEDYDGAEEEEDGQHSIRKPRLNRW